MFRLLAGAVLLVTLLSMGAAAQNVNSVVTAASRAMGMDTLTSITYSGTARNGAFGQSKLISQPQGPINLTQVTQYTRTLVFGQAPTATALVSRATGPTLPPTVPGVPALMPGVFNQNITQMQATGNWGLALNIWTTPWGFLKGALANDSTLRQEGGQQVVSFSPAGFTSPSGQRYTVTGWINAQNLVTKVETRVENTVIGDNLIEFEYPTYQNMNGVQVPTRIVQKQAGMQTFDATITSATPNPANLVELLTPPAPAGRGGAPGGPGGPAGAPPAGPGGPGGRGAAPAGPTVERLGDGVFRIAGNYTSVAVDMGDHILLIESGQSDARGQAVFAAAMQAIPNKPIRFVVNSHPHFDHASGLRAAAAEGITILMHNNSAATMQRLLSGPGTLLGDSLSKRANPRVTVQGIGDREIRRGTNGKVVEIHRVAESEHTDSHMMVYLPAERILYTADTPAAGMPNPNQLQVLRATMALSDRLKLQWDSMIPAHPVMPERVVPRAEVQALLAATQQARN